ncbi:MAG: T9SS type A sorting domain-containing protein [Saprospiraceae bacterium]|nr:T9SS type A sorting domain-containing protein [Saprospiraceae bacterium]
MRILFPFVIVFINVMIGSSQSLIIDHHSVKDFEFIPEVYKLQAQNQRMLFMDRSVGANISANLDCLAKEWASAPNYCKRYQHRDSAYAVDPSEVYWNGVWDRSNWRYEFWPNNCSEDVQCFIDFMQVRMDSFDIVGCQFSYLAVIQGSKIADPVSGFFGSNPGRNHASVYHNFASLHPDKKLVWWTTSLARGIGSPESQAFNNQMREYAKDNQIILFDVADILSHDPTGKPCYDNRDGVDYLDEMNPDDGLDIPAICPQYTTETEGGHLGSIAAGGIRVAKAFWVLMARLSGWNGLPTSTNERLLVSPKIYPNPAKKLVMVEFQNPWKGPVQFEIINSQGHLLKAQNHQADRDLSHFSISLEGLPSGLYILKSKFENGIVLNKFLLTE